MTAELPKYIFGFAGQSVELVELADLETSRPGQGVNRYLVRLHILTAERPSKASASVAVWAGPNGGWIELWSIPGELMKTSMKLSYDKGQPPHVEDFALDRTELMTVAGSILEREGGLF